MGPSLLLIRFPNRHSSSGFPIGDPFDISEIDLHLDNTTLSLDMALEERLAARLATCMKDGH